MHQNFWRLGLRPRSRWGSLQRSPNTLAVRGAGGRECEGVGEGDGEGWEEREAEFPILPPLPQLPGYATVKKVGFFLFSNKIANIVPRILVRFCQRKILLRF